MTTEATEKTKVYELAKQLGWDSFSLLDKLKELSISVKSHMSELSDDDVTKVRDAILKPATPATTTKAKTTVKRSTSTAGATTTATKTTKTTKAATTKTAETKSATATATVKKKTATATSTTTAAADSKKATVIRRRSKDTGEVEVVKTDSSGNVVQTTTTPEGLTTVTTTAPDGSAPVTVTFDAAEAAAAEAAVAAEAAANEAATESKGLGLNMPSFLSAKKDGMTAKPTASLISIVKEEPRKPIIKPTIKPAVKTGITPAGGTPTTGIVSYGKGDIDRMAEEEQAIKKKTGKNDRVEEAANVKISDYRAKKELVFLPKKKRPTANRELNKTQITTPAAHKRNIKIEGQITVSEFAQRMGVKTGELIKKLMGMGVMATMNHALDLDTATLIATDYGFEVTNVEFKEEAVLATTVQENESDLKPRPPIVTIMGHVDHGKTSLLDSLRNAQVAAGEAGGITQHIGAYSVEIDGKQITFLDTPGHEAFTMMRARGANSTDIVILVVAADDGVMPQTREALDHAKAAGCPIIVAVNKVDKPQANPEKVIKDLAELDILAEEWGGQYQFIRVSALKKTGLKELLEAILLQAEVLELKANPNRAAEGIVIESKLDKSRGALVTLLVKKGTLKIGDIVVAGQHVGRVRAMMNAKGEQIKELGPSMAAELLGMEGVPQAGEGFNVMASESEARDLATHRLDKIRAQLNAPKAAKMSLDDLFSKVQTGETKELTVIIKADVFGSAEAIKESLNKLATEKVKVKVISATTGGITESDVMLATASNAIVVGFNVRPETKALKLAEAEHIEIKSYSIIYELIDDIKKAMGGMLEKKAIEKYLGRAEVRDTFTVPKIGTIAGCSVVDGKITRGCQVRLLRDSRVIYTGKLSSLKRFKDDAKEVAQGYECGAGIENFNDIKQGDIIEAFEVDMIAQTLDDVNADAAADAKKEKAAQAAKL